MRCRLAVDATGTNALLARQSRVHEGFRRVGVGYEQELSAPAFGQDEAVILVGGLAPSGYAWAFPRGGTRVRVGVGLIQPDTDLNPRELYAPVERALAERLAGAELLELHSGRIPSQEAPQRLTGDGLMVVGDAGGHSNPLLGEGIRHVIVAARRAAPVAIAALGTPGVVPRERLRAWERAGRRTRGRSWGLAMRANRYVAGMDDADWDRAVETLGRLPAEMATPILRGDILSAPLLAGALARGPSSAWRVLRPFVMGGRVVGTGRYRHSIVSESIRGGPVLREFKEFLFRGNIVDLAVAIVVGTAFVALVNAFVADILTPIIAAIFGKPDFSSLTFHINGSTFLYGDFLNALITFVSVAAAVFFFVVKPLNALAARRAPEPGAADRARVPGVPQHHPGGCAALLALHDRGHAGDGHVALDLVRGGPADRGQ